MHKTLRYSMRKPRFSGELHHDHAELQLQHGGDGEDHERLDHALELAILGGRSGDVTGLSAHLLPL